MDDLLILRNQLAKSFAQRCPLHQINAIWNVGFAESELQIGAGFEAEDVAVVFTTYNDFLCTHSFFETLFLF
jgi:hypothetical protein